MLNLYMYNVVYEIYVLIIYLNFNFDEVECIFNFLFILVKNMILFELVIVKDVLNFLFIYCFLMK